MLIKQVQSTNQSHSPAKLLLRSLSSCLLCLLYPQVLQFSHQSCIASDAPHPCSAVLWLPLLQSGGNCFAVSLYEIDSVVLKC